MTFLRCNESKETQSQRTIVRNKFRNKLISFLNQESFNDISPQKILEEYLLLGKPVMVRGGCLDWKCRRLWTKSRFVEEFGNVMVNLGQITYPEYYSVKSAELSFADIVASHDEDGWEHNHREVLSRNGAPFYMLTDYSDKVRKCGHTDRNIFQV